MQEGLDKLLAARGVLDFRMPLHAVEFAGFILHRGNGSALRVGKHLEALRDLLHSHTVAHPRGLLGRGTSEDAFGVVNAGFGLAILAERRLINRAAKLIRHNLEAIADTEHRDAGLEDLLVDARGAGFEHGGRAAGQDDGLRILGKHLVGGHGMGHKLGIHVGFAHATRDKLGVLRAEIDDEHWTFRHR